MDDGQERWPAGVRPLDHTADVGLVVEAPSLAELFRRAAAGLMVLMGAGDPGAAGAGVGAAEGAAEGALEVEVAVAGPDLEVLLVGWLRELLFLCEVRGVAYADAEFDELGGTALRARVRGVPGRPAPGRELKAVTYHGAQVARRAPSHEGDEGDEGDEGAGGDTDRGWTATVICDV
jgi:SHS2 domain-containing protein